MFSWQVGVKVDQQFVRVGTLLSDSNSFFLRLPPVTTTTTSWPWPATTWSASGEEQTRSPAQPVRIVEHMRRKDNSCWLFFWMSKWHLWKKHRECCFVRTFLINTPQKLFKLFSVAQNFLWSVLCMFKWILTSFKYFWWRRLFGNIFTRIPTSWKYLVFALLSPIAVICTKCLQANSVLSIKM